MDVAPLIDQLAADGPPLIAAAQRAGWDAPVPAIEWNVRELVTHVGGVHRWAADIVRSARASFDTPAGAAVGRGPGDDELAGWFTEGHAALVAALRAAPADLDCATFLPADSPLHFWARRQAHETAIHRVDAQAAAGGAITEFGAAFAQDGIAELLGGFARRKRKPAARPASIALVPHDGPCWLVTLGGDQIESAQTPEPPDAELTVRAGSQQLYRWLWNRPAEVVLDGDVSVAALWATTLRVRWA